MKRNRSARVCSTLLASLFFVASAFCHEPIAAKHRIYVLGGGGFVVTYSQTDANKYPEISRLPTADGGRTGLFIPELKELLVAIPIKEVRMHLYRSIRFSSVILLLCVVSALTSLAQNSQLRGRVNDETGAIVPGATITVTGPAGTTLSTKSAADGSYSLTAIPPGTYVIEAKFTGLLMKKPATFVARGGQTINLNLVLTVNSVDQQVTVKADESVGVSVDSSNNAGAVVLQGSDLDALSDDPDDLASDLQSLAGPFCRAKRSFFLY